MNLAEKYTKIQRSFEYNGKTFTPYRHFLAWEDYFAVSKRQYSLIFGGWKFDYEEFCKAAERANANVDLFYLDGMVVFPCDDCITGYREK